MKIYELLYSTNRTKILTFHICSKIQMKSKNNKINVKNVQKDNLTAIHSQFREMKICIKKRRGTQIIS